MTINANTTKTNNLVDFITLIKGRELYLYESKLLQLEKLLVQEPNNVLHEHKYNLTKQRCQQLKNTANKLRELKLQIRKII